MREDDHSSTYSSSMPEKIVNELITSNNELIDVIAASLSGEQDKNVELWSREAGKKKSKNRYRDYTVHFSI